jgi:uncharacterized membrane protein (UPF0136 family)
MPMLVLSIAADGIGQNAQTAVWLLSCRPFMPAGLDAFGVMSAHWFYPAARYALWQTDKRAYKIQLISVIVE